MLTQKIEVVRIQVMTRVEILQLISVIMQRFDAKFIMYLFLNHLSKYESVIHALGLIF